MKNQEIMKIVVAKNLKQIRESHGLSQTDLGKKFGKDKTTISTWERGVSMPDIITLYKLSKLYRVDINEFYIDHDYIVSNDEIGDHIVSVGKTFFVEPKKIKKAKFGKPSTKTAKRKPATAPSKYRVRPLPGAGTADA